MKVLINGVVYDSTETPIMIEFDSNEQGMFNGLTKFVSTPTRTTMKERKMLIGMDLGINNDRIVQISGKL